MYKLNVVKSARLYIILFYTNRMQRQFSSRKTFHVADIKKRREKKGKIRVAVCTCNYSREMSSNAISSKINVLYCVMYLYDALRDSVIKCRWTLG